MKVIGADSHSTMYDLSPMLSSLSDFHTGFRPLPSLTLQLLSQAPHDGDRDSNIMTLILNISLDAGADRTQI